MSTPWSRRQTDTRLTWREKEDKILQCLDGSGDSINLWELRELALSPGGLLDPKIRKRAWPILTACHADLNDNTNPKPPGAAPSQADLKALRRDVKRTVWDVADHFSQQLASDYKSSMVSKKKRDGRRVSFALDETIEEEDEDVPDIIPSSTMDSDAPNESPSTGAISFDLDLSTNSALSTSVLSQDSSFNGSSRRSRWRKASKHEQKIVSNVVVSVLRSQAPESTCFTDDRYHYFPGLHNLTALILVNLESPSLTSLVLGKLAAFHLRDAMRKDEHIIQNAIELTLFPLLEKVDSALYRKICFNSQEVKPDFATSWISSWFSSDVGDIAVASRLLDLFLVSHPTMPAYFAVALLLHHRKKILSCQQSSKTVQATIRSLSLMATLTAGNSRDACRGKTMEEAEAIITIAIRLMEKVPPASLVGLTGFEAQAISMVQVDDFPSWFDAPRCLTEWGVLQRAKAKREGREVDVIVEKDPVFDLACFPKAAIATGKMSSKPAVFPKVAIVEMLALAVLVFAFVYLPSRSVELLRNPKPILFHQKQLPAVSSMNGNDVVLFEPYHSPVIMRENQTVLVHVSKEIPTVVKYELDDLERAFEQNILLPIHRAAQALVASRLLRLEVMVDRDMLEKVVNTLLYYRFKDRAAQDSYLAIAPPKRPLPAYLVWFSSRIQHEIPKLKDGVRRLTELAKQVCNELPNRPVSAFDDRGFPRLM